MVRSRCIIEAIQKYDLVNNAKEVGKDLLWGLRRIPIIDNVRGRGLMIAFDLPDMQTRDTLLTILSSNMLALKCGEISIRLRPPLTFSEKDADLVCEYIERALDRL